jgi:lysophospholipase L1-like esterase
VRRPYGSEIPRARPSVFIAALVLLLAGPAALVLVLGRAGPSPVQRTLAQARTGSPVPVAGQLGESVCTDPGRGLQWRVSWKAASDAATPGAGSVRDQARRVSIVPTGFSSRPAPGLRPAVTPSAPSAQPGQPTTTPAAVAGPASTAWTSRDRDLWNVRWTPSVSEALSRQSADSYQRQGTLEQLALVPLTANQSPRYVTPDGGCSVFVTPFMAGSPGGRTVAVLGDSLVAQLYASADGLGTSEGALQQELDAKGYRPEINGQSGRRWTALPGARPGLAQANVDMMDEIRGLREAQSVVIALGVNDAGWVALAPDPQTYELRVSWVLLHLGPMLDELRDRGHCTVLLTMSDGDQTYLGSAPGMYQRAARQINAYLVQRAQEDPGDRIKLWDWALAAAGHHTSDPVPWFGHDTIHLNTEGQSAYVQELSQAADSC